MVVGFSGASNSGKTTLIVKVANSLIDRGFKVAIIKNDPKDKAKFDIEGKDSYLFFQTGAEVVVTSPTRTTYFSNENKNLSEIINIFQDFDYLLIEGHRGVEIPRILVARDSIDEEYLNFCDVIAIDDSIKKESISKKLSVLNLNREVEVVEWILENAKELK
jgi:molybdopterin-guanine dinucleotide biosynthesis protein B